MEGFEQLQISVADSVGLIVLNRPRVLNALTSQTLRELIRGVNSLEADPTVRVVLFAGSGDRAFCAGSDLHETGTLDGEGIRRFVLLDFRCKTRISECQKPTIAAIRGYALGGGLELALACDIRFAASDAVLGLPEIGLGTVPGSGAIQRLPGIIGRGLAADLLFTGRKIDAQEAWRIGLVNYVVEPEELLDRAREYAGDLGRKNPIALQGTKVALHNHAATQPAGLEAAYHSLLAQACRVGGRYRKQVDEFFRRKAAE